MKIASIQLNIAWEDKQENLKKAARFIKTAKGNGCDLIVFPEMCIRSFSMNVGTIAEQQNGATSQKLCELANKYNINLIAGYAEKAASKGRNVALHIGRDGKINARYIKNHLFSYANEDKSYFSGNEQVVFEIDGVKSSMFICYDLRFPELFRKVAEQIEIIFVIANWPEVRQRHWESLLQARAIENQCFIVGVNRIGKDGNNLVYAGGSHVFNPLGDDLSRGRKNQEYVVTELDVSEVAAVRKQFPFLKDMKYV